MVAVSKHLRTPIFKLVNQGDNLAVSIHIRTPISKLTNQTYTLAVSICLMRAFHMATKHGELRDFAPENKSPG